MSTPRTAQAGEGASGRPVNLEGDSPELVAFALLRYLAQLEQGQSGISFDREWLLDAYTDCLQAVKGQRVPGSRAGKATSTNIAKGRS